MVAGGINLINKNVRIIFDRGIKSLTLIIALITVLLYTDMKTRLFLLSCFSLYGVPIAYNGYHINVRLNV